MLAKDDTKTIVLEGSKLVYVDERQTKSCTKINYRCKKGCPVRYHLMLHSDSEMVTSYLSNNQHVHIESDIGLDHTTKEKAKELLDLSKNLY